jgi:hypothetical protein
MDDEMIIADDYEDGMIDKWSNGNVDFGDEQ